MNCPKCNSPTERKEIVFTDFLTYYIPEQEWYECACGWKSQTKEIKKSLAYRIKKFFDKIFFD